MICCIKPNEGVKDRIIRGVSGVLLGILAYISEDFIGTVLGIMSGVLIVTAVTGFCGLYKILGINTLEKPSGKK